MPVYIFIKKMTKRFTFKKQMRSRLKVYTNYVRLLHNEYSTVFKLNALDIFSVKFVRFIHISVHL